MKFAGEQCKWFVFVGYWQSRKRSNTIDVLRLAGYLGVFEQCILKTHSHNAIIESRTQRKIGTSRTNGVAKHFSPRFCVFLWHLSHSDSTVLCYSHVRSSRDVASFCPVQHQAGDHRIGSMLTGVLADLTRWRRCPSFVKSRGREARGSSGPRRVCIGRNANASRRGQFPFLRPGTDALANTNAGWVGLGAIESQV